MSCILLNYFTRIGKTPAQPQNTDTVDLDGENTSSSDRRFAYSLLEKLIQYLDVAAFNMKLLRPSTNYSRRTSFKMSTRDVKFFSKVLTCYFQPQLFANLNQFYPGCSTVDGEIF